MIKKKILSDHQYGNEEVTKQCGAKEVNGLIYEEGCETSDVPYKRKECYCRRNLCNNANPIVRRSNLILILFSSFSICISSILI